MKKQILNLSLFLCMLVSATLSARAYTVDEIIANSEWMTARYKYLNELTTKGYYLSPYEEETLHFEKVDKSHIKVTGFAGSLAYIFTLGKSYVVSSSSGLTAHDANEATDGDGDCIYITGQTKSTDGTKLSGSSNYRIMLVAWDTKQNYSNISTGKNVFLLKEDNDGSFYFEEVDDYYGMFLASSGTAAAQYLSCIIGHTIIKPFKGNGMCTDTYNNWEYSNSMTQSTARSFPVNVNLDFTNNTFTIENFSNKGHAIDGSRHNFGNNQTSYIGDAFDIHGTIIPEENKLVFAKNQYARQIFSAYRSGRSTLYDWFPFKLQRFDQNDKTDELFGWYTLPEDGKPSHNVLDNDHGWVTNHGKRRTFNGASIEIETYSYCNYDETFYRQLNWCDAYENTVISCGDVTLDVDLQIESFEYDATAKHGRLKAEIITNRNDMYVDHYDVMFVKGHRNHIDESGFVVDNELGHAGAKVLCHGPEDMRFGTVAQSPARRAVRGAADNVSHDYTVDHWVHKDYADDHFDADGKYTFFVRANYKEETGLAPTFHALTYAMPTSATLTGVDNVSADFSAGADAEYYTLGGMRTDAAALVPGVYIRRQGDKASKIVIK